MGFDLYSTGDHKTSKGEYFRNNVWWWRPLAQYVIEYTKCVSKEDAQRWNYNDYHEVDEDEAKAIAKQLKHLLKTGHTKKHAEQYERERKKAEEFNKKIEKQTEALQNKVGKDIAPNDYSKEDKKKWDSLQAKKIWEAYYPFSVTNVKEFAEFCEDSRGFRIG
jgi:hypothetical protein